MRVAALPDSLWRTSPKPGVRSREAVRISFSKWVGTPTPLVGAWISTDVLEFVERLPRRIGQHLRLTIKAIGRDPYGHSDAVSHDELARRLEIAMVGDYALMFWIDEADRHVKVIDIHAADR